jgi:putative holliday junction resolvase
MLLARQRFFFLFLVIFRMNCSFKAGFPVHTKRKLTQYQGNWGPVPPQRCESKSPLDGNSKVLGVDYGLKVVGTAICAGWAPRRLFAVPHSGDDREVALRLVEISKRESARTIVVGLPLHKDGSESGQSILTRKFAHLLASLAGPHCRVILLDERFSSRYASAQMQHMKQRQRETIIDEESACALLESFFSSSGIDGNGGGELVPFSAEGVEETVDPKNNQPTIHSKVYQEDTKVQDINRKRIKPTKQKQFELDVADLTSEILRRAAALDNKLPIEDDLGSNHGS